MRLATTKEIEYLGAVDGKTASDAGLIDEMSRRLDVLRRFDQCFCDEDWHPHFVNDGTGDHPTFGF